MHAHTHAHTHTHTQTHTHTHSVAVETHISLHPVHCARVDVHNISLVLSEPVDWDIVSVQLIQYRPPRPWKEGEGGRGREREGSTGVSKMEVCYMYEPFMLHYQRYTGNPYYMLLL